MPDENHFAECLEEALAHGGEDPRARTRAAKRSAAWRILKPEWKGMLLGLLNIAAGAAQDQPVRPAMRGGRRGGMRTRRGGRQLQQVELLEAPESLATSDGPAAYRLAGLLLQKHRLGEQWSGEWDESIAELRGSCLKDGVHPIWPRLGAEFDEVLGELALLEAIEASPSDLDEDWLRLARIDPLHTPSLVEFLSPPLPAVLPARIASPLQELHAQLERRGERTKPAWLAGRLKSRDWVPILVERTGATGLIAALLASASDSGDAQIRFTELADDAGVGELAADHLSLLRIRAGDADVWDECRNMPGDDGLASACRLAAWSCEPPDDIELSIEELETGLSELLAADVDDDALREVHWRLVRAQRDAGDLRLAAEAACELEASNESHIRICLSLLEADDTGFLRERLHARVQHLSVSSLLAIIRHPDTPTEIALSTSERLRNLDESQWSSASDDLLSLFVTAAAIEPLAGLLAQQSELEQQHPLLVLLIHQLLPADAPAEVKAWLRTARSEAQLALDVDAQHPLLSEVSRSLILQLEGVHVESTAVFERLDKKGLKAYKQCTHALGAGSRKHIGSKDFSDLSQSIHNAELDALERRLFGVVLTELQLGWAIHARDSHAAEQRRDADSLVDDIIREDGRLRLLDQVHSMVLEHGLASSALVEWHENNTADAFWSALASASVHEHEGERELAARAFRRAASAVDDIPLPDNFDSELQLRSSLQKEALKNYAHAACWTESVQLLENIDNLVANIKRVFDLFLRVSEAADRGQLNPATRMVLEHARAEVKDEQGVIDEELLLEQLHSLLSYPSELKLPEDPFRGRVLVAINGIRSGHRRSQAGSDSRFRRAVEERDVPAIGELARRTAEGRGVEHGLLVYERAMNSGRFAERHVSQLTDMMKGLFSRHDSDLPIRRRMHLSRLKLKPLVLMDTNLLIDALRDQLLAQVYTLESPVTVESRLAFHRTLLYRMQQGRIDLTVPEPARKELRKFITSDKLTRGLLGKRNVSDARWKELGAKSSVKKLAEQLISEYSNWHAPCSKQFEQQVESRRPELLEFMSTSLSGVYLGIDDVKQMRGVGGKRTGIAGEHIYPEKADLEIMLIATELVERSDPAHGSVLVASRDSDFTIPGRALQERFGFAVADKAPTLARWVHH